MGAILPPRHTPPKRLFGTKGMSSPVNHSTELVADLRDDPVPTTAPTLAPRCLLSLRDGVGFAGPRVPSSSAVNAAPSRLCFDLASACSGISGGQVPSVAGDR